MSKFFPEVRKRAVQMVQERRGDHPILHTQSLVDHLDAPTCVWPVKRVQP